MHRFTAFSLIILFLLSLSAFLPAHATDVEALPIEEELPIPETCCGPLSFGIPLAEEEPAESYPLRLAGSSDLTLEETLAEGCRARAKSIDVAKYRIPEEEMPDHFAFFVMKHGDLMVGAGYGYNWSRGTDGIRRITKINPVYLFPEAEMPQKQKEWQDYLDSYVTEAKQFSNPLEQVLYVHDKLVLSCVYASEAATKMENGTLTNEDFIYWHAFQLFSGGTVVCQGYAQAFYAIMQELGYPVDFCCNAGHVWNYLKLGDAWYHVDVTWDDPVPDDPGKTRHNYFLRTDASMDDHSPEEWITDLETLPVCNSTKYESGYIFNISNGKVIEKEETGYRMTCWDMDFSSDSLWTGTVLTTPPENGKIRYIYMKEPETPISIYTARKDSENILRGGGFVTRTGESQYNSNGSLSLRSYTLPTGPANATSGTLYFRDSKTQRPVGPVLQF